MRDWPAWWFWEVELSSHLFDRMLDRSFTEMDLRIMLEDADGYHADIEPGRWAIETRREGNQWGIIVEPDETKRVLVIVPAYKVT